MSNNPGRASLDISGHRHEGWLDISVRHSIEDVASGFTLQLTDRWAHNMEARTIRRGDACRLALMGEQLITGYVDLVNPGHDKDARRLSVSGRAKTADLVDCSVAIEGGQFKGRSLLQIAVALCKPFGIEVVNQVPEATQPLTTDWQLEPGETAYESLERAARFVRALLIPDPQGRLVICRAGNQVLPVHLRFGENLLEADAQYDDRDRFSEYRVIGDSAAGGAGWDNLDGPAVTQTMGSATDSGIRRYRPLILVGEDNLDTRRASERADWEMRRRRARAQTITATVQGWTVFGSSRLWPLNHLLHITDPWLGLNNEQLLISAIDFTKSDKGTRSVLTLMPKEGFDIEPISAPKQAGASPGGGW